MTKLVDLPADLYKNKLTHGFFDDFHEYVTTDMWTLVPGTDGECNKVEATPGGEIFIETATNSAGDDGDETAMIHTTQKPFFFAANKPIQFGCRIHKGAAGAETGTAGDFSFFAGISGVIVDGLLPAAEAQGMVATANEAVGFYGNESSATADIIHAHAQCHETATDVELAAATSRDGNLHTMTTSYKVLEFTWLPVSSTAADIMYYIDGVLVAKSTDVSYATTPAAMSAVLAVKSGAGTTMETLYADYVYCYQTR